MRVAPFVVFTGLLMLSAAVAHAQPLTLAQAIAEGLRGEPELKAARLAADAARGEREQAALRPNPMIGFEQREQMGGGDRQTSVMFEMPLDTFKRGPRMEAAGRSVERTDADIRDRERLLANAIREAYGAAAADARRLEVMDGVVAAAKRTYDLLGNRVTEGAAPPLERDLALIDVRRLEGERELAAGRIAAALARLKILLGRPPQSDLRLEQTLDELVAVNSAEGAVAAERADVTRASAEVALARAELAGARQETKPEFTVVGGYMRMNQGFPQFGLSPLGVPEPIHGIFHNVVAGVKMSLPVFNRGQGAVAAAMARETAAIESLAARRLAVAGEVDAATARMAAARRALGAYSDDTRALARRNLDVVRETYTLGRATLFDVLNEQRRYLEFEAAFIDALAESFAASTELLRAKGEDQ